ncbi:SMI1/KNR4 family protein [Corynebacterium ureicelerivorans]|uniref:Knr4/Smi1-like domain-containing protein n=1 Tax=Corynebacterium ureicelerivorans TaxID=401472 RepID=A0A077HMT0_9CORY|nr:SMI1/KNR4 family protein [Corynebacterium ureicelerivorans]AIL97721.1 hypothetical protein CUREI_11015 [Corynebacterium ureicelerivorans]
MTVYTDMFTKTGDPADEARLTEIEHAIGRRLPDDYRALIKETGGGTLKLTNCVMPGLPEGVGRLATDDIFGNGTTETTRTFDLATHATFLMEEWEIPDEVRLGHTTGPPPSGLRDLNISKHLHPALVDSPGFRASDPLRLTLLDDGALKLSHTTH